MSAAELGEMLLGENFAAADGNDVLAPAPGVGDESEEFVGELEEIVAAGGAPGRRLDAFDSSDRNFKKKSSLPN